MKLPAAHFKMARQDPQLMVALVGEFLGVLLLQLMSGVIGGGALEVGLTFAALSYAFKYISGGHLNPAVSMAVMLSGHIDWMRGLLYMVVQFLGAIFGALLHAGLVPGAHVRHESAACVSPTADVNNWQLFGWETLLTFLFIVVMYSAVFVRPGHGDAAPLAAGFTLAAAIATGGAITGNSPLNPARAFASSLIFNCRWGWTVVYLLSELTAACIAALWALWAYGKGLFFGGENPMDPLRERLLGGQRLGPGGTIPYEGYPHMGTTTAGMAGEPSGTAAI